MGEEVGWIATWWVWSRLVAFFAHGVIDSRKEGVITACGRDSSEPVPRENFEGRSDMFEVQRKWTGSVISLYSFLHFTHLPLCPYLLAPWRRCFSHPTRTSLSLLFSNRPTACLFFIDSSPILRAGNSTPLPLFPCPFFPGGLIRKR